MKSILLNLKQHCGSYQGRGKNHEGQPFLGTYELAEIARGSGLQIRFEAQSLDKNIIYHSEVSVLALTADGGLSLFNLNSNTPFLSEHKLVSDSTLDGRIHLVFRFGNTDDKNSFREEIALELAGQDLSYEYAWGMPGKEFATRSEVRMTLFSPNFNEN